MLEKDSLRGKMFKKTTLSINAKHCYTHIQRALWINFLKNAIIIQNICIARFCRMKDCMPGLQTYLLFTIYLFTLTYHEGYDRTWKVLGISFIASVEAPSEPTIYILRIADPARHQAQLTRQASVLDSFFYLNDKNAVGVS